MLKGGSRGIVGFDPTTIPGCTVWFDAADTGTMSLSVSSVQTWRSKGSAACTAVSTFNAPSLSTIGGLSALYFNGISTMMKTNTIASYGATETTWITCAASLATVSGSTPADACPVIATSGSGGERAIRYTCNVNATVYTSNTPVLRQSTGDNTNGVRGFIDTAAYFAAFTNGSLVTSNTTAVTFQAGVNQSFVMGQWNVGWLNGYVYEILIYNRALTLGEYQSVEGYLAQKWGFSPAKVFKPTSIPGCQLWLDGADPAGTGIAPGNNSIISTWMDKSGTGNNGISYGSPTFVTSAVNGNPSISFDGSTQRFSGPITNTGTTVSAFAVASMNSGGSYGRIVSLGSTTNYDGGITPLYFIAIMRAGTTQNLQSYRYTTTTTNTTTLTYNAPFQAGTVVDGTNDILYVNGTGGTSASSTGAFGYTRYGIGREPYTQAEFFQGYISEVIVYNAALTTAQRQQIEGYLGWKWGLQGSLPSAHPYYTTTANFVKSGALTGTHPYYNQMPMVRPFTPIDIPGCQMWLDGADTSIIGFSS